MGGRHKNFEDPMPFELIKRENKFQKFTFFWADPLLLLHMLWESVEVYIN